MVLRLEQKKALVTEISGIMSNSISAVVADYRGLSSPEMTELREKARNSGIYLRVIRNNIANRAIEGTDFTCLKQVFVGPMAMFLSESDPGAPARLVKDFMKNHANLEVKALAVSGQLLEAGQLDIVAKLPTREEALAQLMSVMQAPIAKFVRTLAEPSAKLVRTVAALRDKKQAEQN